MFSEFLKRERHTHNCLLVSKHPASLNSVRLLSKTSLTKSVEVIKLVMLTDVLKARRQLIWISNAWTNMLHLHDTSHFIKRF